MQDKMAKCKIEIDILQKCEGILAEVKMENKK